MTPKELVKIIGKEIPNVWTVVKSMRSDKGNKLPNWPDWCYLPLAAGYAIASQDSRYFRHPLYSPAAITAAASWRVSQGVYRFDADLYNSLTSQPLDGKIPCDALKRLPEWCVFIETYNASFAGVPFDGFFAHLEKDMNDGREELRLFLLGEKTSPIIIHLGDLTIEQGIERMLEESKRNVPFDSPDWLSKAITDEVVPLIQLVLYLCAENIDIPKPIQHPGKRVRMSGNVDVPKEQRVWNVGERIGSTIRKDRNQSLTNNSKSENIGTSPRSHIRRAHWHHYWTGSGTDKQLVLRWLAPIFVGSNDDDNPVVIHKVK